MSTRILYSDPATSQEIASLTYEELGRVDNGVWVACPDETVLSLADRRQPMFLYFDRREYEVAVNALSPTQVQEVIKRRRDRWSFEAMSFVISRLFDLERVCLEGALRLADQEMTADVEQSLTLLQRLAGLERYEMLPAKAMAVNVLEGEARLIATLQSALDAGLPEGAEGLANHLEQRRKWAMAVSQVVAALGLPEFANALPFATPARAVFVHPAETELAEQLRKEGEPVVNWRDGLVYASTERHLEPERAQGLSVEILYADASEFYGSVESLTKAQLHRDFAARQGRSPTESGRDRLGEIDRLHLHQILMKRQLRQRKDASQACQSVGFDRMLREETQLLGRSLVQTQSFSRSEGMESLTPRALFRQAQETAQSNVSFFATIAGRFWPSIAPELSRIAMMQKGGRGPSDVSNP